MSGESEAKVKGDEPNQPLKSLGKYLIERKLGQGGMGAVYLARHKDLKKLVALKVLPRDKAENPTLVKRFKAEAQAAAHLEHPNIVAVYDTGEADGYLYISMEYVDGIDLFEYLKRRKTVPVKRSIEIIKQTASALQHAFEQNIVHRDIKPSNLMLRRDGTVKLADLGLARSIDDTLETNITRAGTTVGTVDYMAPEQARNSKTADIRSDIYSLGCTWYQMLTGEPPYPDGGMMNKLAAHSMKPLPDPRSLNEAVPEGIFAILQRMTAKKPDDRYQTPAELIEDINRSKLTKAAFSNEILDDIADEDAAVDDSVADDDEGDDEDDREDGNIGGGHRGKGSSTRNVARPRVDDDDEISRERVRRKSRTTESDDQSDHETRPLKPRSKPLSKPSSRPFDEEPDELPSKLSRTSHLSTNSGSSSKSGARSKSTSKSDSSTRRPSNSDSEKSGKKPSSGAHDNRKLKSSGSKPLPPKRDPVDEEAPPPFALDFETIRKLGLVAGVVAIVCSVGGLIFYWAGQFDSVDNNRPEKPQPVVNVVQPPVQPAPVETKEATTNNFIDRPAVDLDLSKQPLPKWATSDGGLPKDLPTLLVGPRTSSSAQYSDLNEALRAVGSKGGIVLLQGNGPFELSNAELRVAKKLVIAPASPEDQPIIMVKPADASGVAVLSIFSCEVDLRSVHFLISQSSGSAISVNDGQLYVRNCSFTTTSSDAASGSVLSFNSQIDSQASPNTDANLLLDRVMIRGNGLTGVQVNRTMANIVVQDSLIVTGAAPAIAVAGRLTPGLIDTLVDKPRRIFRVLRSTLCARKNLFEFSADNTAQPPMTVVLLQDSICSAEGTGISTILVSAARWPSVSNPGGWLTNLTWLSVSSLYLGFDRLVELDRSYKVTDAESWQRIWGAKRVEAMQFQKIHWPDSEIADLSSIQPLDFDNSRLTYREVKSSNGGMPGCQPDRINIPRVISQLRLQAMSQRSKDPVVATKVMDVSQARKVDLTKDDLGQVLNKGDWPSGTVFEASGFGTRTMSPAKITDKSVQIVFRQTDGSTAPLKLQTKSAETSKAKSDSTGLFTITNGSLELQNVVLEATSGKAVSWLINARNSNVVLRGCQFSGSAQPESEPNSGLIQWTTTDADSPATKGESPFLSIKDSFLMSNGIGIRTEHSRGNVFLRNCIVTARGYGLSVAPLRSNANPTIDLEHVTFSASKAAIRVEASAESDTAGSPVKMFVESCAVVAPIEMKPGEADESTVLEFEGTFGKQKQIEWWGNSNGFASELTAFLRQPNAEPVNTAAGWEATWGESAAVRLLLGPKGVQLSRPLPAKWNNLKPSAFALDPDSQSAKWGPGSTMIGAKIQQIEEATTLKKISKEVKAGIPNTKKAVGGGSSF